jgi:DNA polymerase-1
MSEGKTLGGPGSFFVIDANNFVFRAYHGLPMLTAPDGTPVNAVHGYVRMVQALRREHAPQHILAVFDAKGPSFRREIFDQYKANRPPAPEDLVPQFPLVREATAALGIPWTEEPGFEADDLIATYALAGQKAGLKVTVISSDKDLMQLIDEEGVERPIRLWDSMKSRLFDPEAVLKKFGVRPGKLGDLLALAGDSVDNIPGVPGIGPKTAATLLEEYGDLDGILDNAQNIKQKRRRERLIEHARDARMSRDLVELRRDAPMSLALDSLQDPGTDQATIQAFFGPLGFKSVLGASPNMKTGPAGGRRSTAPVASGALDGLDESGVACLAPRASVLGRDERGRLREFLTEARERGGLGFHLELSGDDSMTADIIGVGLAHAQGGEAEVLYLPVAHRSLTDLPGTQFELEELRELLAGVFADSEFPKYAHGHKGQTVVLARHDMELAGVRVDSMLASYTLDPARTSHDLDTLLKDLAAHTCIKREKLTGKGRKRVDFDQVGVSEALAYEAERVVGALVLGRHLEGLIDKAGPEVQRLFHEVEMPLARVLSRIEMRGVALDAEVFADQSVELGGRLERLRAAIEAEAGHPVNPESPKQLQTLLFEERGLPAKKKTKTGYSTDASVLEELSMLDPIVKLILEHRSLTKLKGTYLDTLPKLVLESTGRLHTHFRQAVAQTGRLSSRDPNLQNIPIRSELGRRIREGFVAPEGSLLVTLDYSQIELRVLAHMSKDEALCRAFNEGADVHRRTASEIFEIPEEEVSSEQRTVAKAVNFGVVYGQSAFGLSQTLGIPRGRAGRYIKKYFERIPGVAAYMDELIERARRDGYAETILGRRRRIPELASRGAAKAYGERIARNTPIQGSAADVLKIAMIEVERLLESADWARMLLTVHDELIFECEAGRADELVSLVKPAMEGAVELSVPLLVDGGAGRSWAEAKS